MDIERMTGLSRDQLVSLSARVADLLGPDELAKLQALSPFRSLVAVVTYLRQNTTQDFLGAIFDVSQATISRRIGLLEPKITAALAPLLPDPVEATKGDIILIDGTLIATGDWADQNDMFSGKHHQAGFNLQIAATIDGRLLAVGNPVHGIRNDYRALTESGLADRLAGCLLVADLGYYGYPGVLTARKKPYKRTMDRPQKTTNQSIATIRAPVERVIAHVKNWKILRTGYRGPLHTFDTALNAIIGLYFYEHSHRVLPTP